MAYELLAKDGRPIMKDGMPVKAMDFTIEKIEQLDEGSKSFIAVASTEDEDRDKDIIRQDGWNLKNFKKNPMIPWSHNYWGIPVAKSLRTWVADKKLLFKPQFDEGDDDSIKIFNKYRKGFLKAFSVGFKGIDYKYRDEDDRWWGGIEFLEQELLEISAVTIPANPNATVSLNGGDTVQNLLQLGYPQRYAKTEQGLFYPIREELGEFINPEVKALEGNEDVEGIQSVRANIISEKKEDGSVGDPMTVGYYFDPEKWTTGEIKSWINDNNEKTYKFHYYNWKWIGDDNEKFEVEEKEEEKDIPDFDEPIKVLTTQDVPGHDKDDDPVPDVCPAPIDDDIEDSEKSLKEHLDEMNKILDKHLEAVTNGIAVSIEKFFEGLSEIKSLLSEKTVALDKDLDNNKSNDDLDNPNDDKKHDSKSDDDIELDDSLLSPGNDKTNDNDIIELDDDLLSDKDNAKDAVKSVFSDKLKETLKEVRDSFKIEV